MELKDWLPYIGGTIIAITTALTFIKQLRYEKPDLVKKYAELANIQFDKNKVLSDRIDSLEIEVDNIKEENKLLKAEIESLQEENIRLSEENDAFRKEISTLRRQIKRKQNKNDRQDEDTEPNS